MRAVEPGRTHIACCLLFRCARWATRCWFCRREDFYLALSGRIGGAAEHGRGKAANCAARSDGFVRAGKSGEVWAASTRLGDI